MKELSSKMIASMFFAIFLSLTLTFHPFIPDSYANEAKTLVFASPRLIGDPLITQLSEVYTKILSQIGYGFEYKQLPAKQASIASNSGQVDGELTRVYSYNSTFKNLIRVEEPLHRIEFSAYAAAPDLSFEGWESLKGYRVDCRRGVIICTKHVSKVTTMHETNTIDQLVTRLLNGYSDVTVQNAEPFEAYMASDTFKQLDPEGKIHKAGIMQTITAHMFLHKRHRDIAPKISKLLKEMKETGEYQQIRGWPESRME